MDYLKKYYIAWGDEINTCEAIDNWRGHFIIAMLRRGSKESV